MHARLPKDLDRATLGSYFYKGTVQTAQTGARSIPSHPGAARIRAKSQALTPKTQDNNRNIDCRARKAGGALCAHTDRPLPRRSRSVSLRDSNHGPTLPNGREKCSNFDNPCQSTAKKLARLTGSNTDQPVQLEATPKKQEIIVDRDDRDEEDSSDEDLTDESGADDPADILRKILRANGDVAVTQQDKYFGPPKPTTNRLVWGFPDYEEPGLYGVEGSQKKEEDKRANEQIARAEWARMAREEIEQREIDAKRLRIARETDYLRLKGRFVGGPMDVLDFFVHCALAVCTSSVYMSVLVASKFGHSLWSHVATTIV